VEGEVSPSWEPSHPAVTGMLARSASSRQIRHQIRRRPCRTTMTSRLQFPQSCPPASRSASGAGGQDVPRNYLVKYQYSGSMVNSGLNVTLCSLLLTAMIR
jgi:hypothetical protein